MEWFRNIRRQQPSDCRIFLLVLILIGCGVAFSDLGNGIRSEGTGTVTDTKKETAEEEKSSDAEVKKEDAAKEEVSSEEKNGD